MYKIILFLSLFILFSCVNKKDDPLIIPPNFAEMPDPKNPEKPSEQQSDADIERLKDLLLKSE